MTPPAMAYSTNTDLGLSFDGLQIVQCVDDNQTNLTTINDVEAAAADSRHQFNAEAIDMLNRIDKARTDADELINTFLRGRHEVPLETVPGFIAELSNDLTRHNLYKRRMGLNMPDDAKELKGHAMALLLKIQRGTLKISDSPNVDAGHFKTNKTGRDRLFKNNLLDRF